MSKVKAVVDDGFEELDGVFSLVLLVEGWFLGGFFTIVRMVMRVKCVCEECEE